MWYFRAQTSLLTLEKIPLKRLAFFSLALQLATLLVWLVPTVIFHRSIISSLVYVFLLELLFYIFFFFVALSRLVETKEASGKWTAANIGYFLLCLPLLFIGLFILGCFI